MKDNNNTDIELLTDFAIDVSESANGLCVLIKHDYYSSDNENGKALLDNLLDSLIISSDRVYLIIVTDSAVKLIDTSDKLNQLMNTINTTLVCRESLDFYGIDIPSFPEDKVHVIPMAEIAEQIIESRPGLIIE